MSTPSLPLSDQIRLKALATKHGMKTDLDDILRKAHRLTREDFKLLNRIMRHMPSALLETLTSHDDFPRVVDRFAELAPGPRHKTLTLLKLGIPVMGVVLPELARQRIFVRVWRTGSTLYADGRPIEIKELSTAQLGVLSTVSVVTVS